MFGFEPEEAKELGSAGRFHAWVVHNGLAHAFLALAPVKWSFQFHDWTSRKLNAE